MQVANAEKHGAVGALVYADPSFSAQQGYEASQVYPKGPWLPPSGIQEGSILFSSYVGDPLTPVLPSTKGMYRRRANESMLPKIPAQPISYEAAMELLQRLGGILRYHCYFTFSFLFLSNHRSSWYLASHADVLRAWPLAVRNERLTNPQKRL